MGKLMNNNLFVYEMRKNALSLILWMTAITVLIALTMSVYPAFIKNQSNIFGVMNLLPNAALQFKGISNITDLLSVLGFYAVNNIIYMMLLGSVFSIVLSSNMLLKEEYNKTAEYLLARPVTRSEIFWSKLVVVGMHIFLLNLVATIAGFISMEIVKNEHFSIRAFITLSVYTLLLNLLFGSIGVLMSTLVKKPKPITTFGIGLVLILYFIFTISKITDSISKIGYLSPFKYVDVNVANSSYRLEFLNVIYFAGISALLITISYLLYCRKDIYT
jgi:ABC-2 type transport system permease protein